MKQKKAKRGVTVNIHANFVGGNITVENIEGNHVHVKNQLRNTSDDWFYWAFCVEGAAGQELTFHFERFRLGKFGPAVSHDFENWEWLGQKEGDSFTYRFSEDENCVYFAHHMLYPMHRFDDLIEKYRVEKKVFCQSGKGRNVPYITFGEGEHAIILTARHHACESTGDYVLEGVVGELLQNPIPNTTVLVVPFMDYDGVVDGDQGKFRIPHDHNQDYAGDSIYPEIRAMKKYATTHPVVVAFDFHSPWHEGGENDNLFIVEKGSDVQVQSEREFARILEEELTPDAMDFKAANNHPFMVTWNKGTKNFSFFMNSLKTCHASFALETTYFGTPENQISQAKLLAFGKCFAKAMQRFLAERI